MGDNSRNNPWIALSTYTEEQAYKFKGREKDTEKILTMLQQNDCVVCYGASGNGKSSVINAGVCPAMRKLGLFPITITFNKDDYKNESIDFDELIYIKIKEVLSEYSKKYKDNHKITDDYLVQFERVQKYEGKTIPNTMWWKLRTETVQVPYGEFDYIPVIIFDQFEEIFRATWKGEFFKWLETLCNDVCPEGNHDLAFGVDTPYNKLFKLFISLRYEYIAELDDWCSQKNFIPQIMQNRYYLRPLSREQAADIITKQPVDHNNSEYHTTLNKIKDNILDFIDKDNTGDIEPFLLSVLCYRYYELALQLGKNELGEEDIKYHQFGNVIRNFYETEIKRIIPRNRHLSFLEHKLVDDEGEYTKRNRIKISELKEIEFEKYSNALEKAHLIRITKFNKEENVELVHDRLADAIVEKRRESTKRKKILFARIASFLTLFGLFFLTYFMQVLPTDNQQAAKNLPYLRYQEKGQKIIDTTSVEIAGDYSIESIKAEDVTASNCPNLKYICLNNKTVNVKVTGCGKLERIAIDPNCRDISLAIVDCPNLSPIFIPAEIEHVSFTTLPPNTLSFRTDDQGKYVWKDNILWNTKDATIVYARYDAPNNVTPPVSSKKDTILECHVRSFYNENRDSLALNNYDRDSLTLYFYNDKNEWKSVRLYKYKEEVNLRGLSCESTSLAGWDMSKFPNLRRVELPSSMKYVSDRMFKGCSQLEVVRLPDSLLSIGADAFDGCSSLQEIIFPSTVHTIESRAFYGCASLKEIRLPDSVCVAFSAFDKCTSLDSVYLPRKLTVYRGYYPDFFFKGCPNVRFAVDKSNKAYSVEDDGTIVYHNFVDKGVVYPILFINAVKKHTYNSKVLTDGEGNTFRYHSKDGNLFFEKNGHSALMNAPNGDIRQRYKSISGSEIVTIPLSLYSYFFADGDFSNCREIHYPMPSISPSNKAFLDDIPSIYKQDICLFVPYGSLSYFLQSCHSMGFDASEWKGVEEEPLLSSMYTICKYHFCVGIDVVSNWGIWWYIIVAVLLFAILMTYYYQRKTPSHSTVPKSSTRFVVNLLLTTVVGAVVWYTIYWFVYLSLGRMIELDTLVEKVVHNVFCVLVSFCMAVIFVYVVLYSGGFSLKGFWNSSKRICKAFIRGLSDSFFLLRNFSWKSFCHSIKYTILYMKDLLRKAHRMVSSTIISSLTYTKIGIRRSLQFFITISTKKKTLISVSVFVIACLVICFSVRECKNNDPKRNDIMTYCKKIIEKDTITREEIDSLHDKLVKSISIEGMRTRYSSYNFSPKALHDSIFVFVESGNCQYLDFASMKQGDVNFGQPMQDVDPEQFKLSDSERFVCYHQNDSIFVWAKNRLGEIPFIAKTYSNNSDWFASDRYVGLRTDIANYSIYDTETWKLLSVIEGPYQKSCRISDKLLIAIGSYYGQQSEAIVIDESMRRHKFLFEGQLMGDFDGKYIVSKKDDTYLLYSIKDGALLDKKDHNKFFYFNPGDSYGRIFYCSDSTFILKVFDEKLVLDTIPFENENYNKKHICYKKNDSILIYHIPTNNTYNLGICKRFSNVDSLIATSDGEQITVYNFGETMKMLCQIPSEDYWLSMNKSNDYVLFGGAAKGLFRYNSDSLWLVNSSDRNLDFNGWYCSDNDRNIYSLDEFDEGSWTVTSDMKSEILRGGWCFWAAGNVYEIGNVKSIKLLIKESRYIDKDMQEKLCRLIDKHYAKRK